MKTTHLLQLNQKRQGEHPKSLQKYKTTLSTDLTPLKTNSSHNPTLLNATITFMKIKNLQSFYLLVDALEKLPSIGKKSAEKMAYTLCVENKLLGLNIAKHIQNASSKVCKCSICGGLSEQRECQICQDEERNNGELCIIAHPRDIAIIENTGSFRGRYFVLESLESVDFESLTSIIIANKIKEIIFSFSPSLANDALMLFVEDRLSALGLSFSKIAQGIPTGIGLDHIDQLSLSRAFEGRIKL